jgi:septal ring factor EnvC (AmiA/AmiB activator)
MAITVEMVGFMIVVLGAISGIWWRVEAKYEGAKKRADDAAEALAAYKTHVAEQYVTKDGLREQLSQVMAGITELKQQLAHVASRVDTFIDQPRPPR